MRASEKFRLGDKVKVVKANHSQTGEIGKVISRSDYDIRIQFENGACGVWSNAESLELLPSINELGDPVRKHKESLADTMIDWHTLKEVKV